MTSNSQVQVVASAILRLVMVVGLSSLLIAVMLFMLVLSVRDASAQEVTVQPGDTVTVVSPPLPPPVPPETTYVEVPVIEIDTVYACPPGWECTEPVVEVDSVPPLAVSGVTAIIEGNEMVVSWNNRPNPDRGGVGTDGYYVASGNNTTGINNPTANVLSTPHRIALAGFGELWVCVTPHNVAGVPESSCIRVDYDAPASPYLLSVTADSATMSGTTTVVEGTYSVHLDRIDGAWQGLGDVSVSGVDSVVMCSGGVCNRERRLPYELSGGKIGLVPGSYPVSWRVYGTEPDSGSSTVTVTATVGEVPADSADFWLGQACAWGETRCLIVNDSLQVNMLEGQSLKVYATVELPDDPRMFVVLQDSYAAVQYEPTRGWICLIEGGDVLTASEMDPPSWPEGTVISPPPSCGAPVTDA